MPSGCRNFSEITTRLAAAEACGWEKTDFGRIEGGYPICVLEKQTSPQLPNVLVVAGIHGNEPAGSEAALQWVEHAQPEHEDFNWMVIPCANPYGWVHNKRTNSRGHDLNRHFRETNCCEESDALIRAVQGRRFVFSMNFHEDNQASGFYLCELKRQPPCAGELIVEAVSNILPICQSQHLDGRRATFPGCVRRCPVANATLERRRFWPLEFYLLLANTAHAFCAETPQIFPLEQRVAAHHAALRAACTFSKTRSALDFL